jgi:DNA primase
MIPQNFIDEIQSRTDIVELIGSYISLKRSGRNFKALCPFHGEKTPSFMVSPQKQIYHCFGCSQGGGIFQFVEFMEKVTFPEAVEILARRIGLSLPEQVPSGSGIKNSLYEAVKDASLFFHNNLKDTKRSASVLKYLRERGIAEKTINFFFIGLAFSGNDLMNYLRGKGVKLDILAKASLVAAKDQGYRDLFRDRIMFPIFDVRSRVVGFGGRIFKDQARAPKYINSPEGALYSKREHFFGLNFSKEEISKQNSAIVVEGYLDMITPFMRGVKNIVASLGTSLTQEQIRLIKRYTDTVILVFDSDKAGQSASLRSIDLLLESDVKTFVVQLPKGYDPDSLSREKGIDHFKRCLEEKKDFFEYKIGLMEKAYNKKTIEGKTKIAQELLSTINKLQSEIKKYEYIKSLSAYLDIKEEILIAEFRKSFSKESRAYKPAVPGDGLNKRDVFSRTRLSYTEKIILKCMFMNQKAFALVKKNCHCDDFKSSPARLAVSYFYQHHKEDDVYTIAQRIGVIKMKELSSFVSQIIMDDDIPFDKNSFKDSIVKLKKQQQLSLKQRLKEKIKEAEDSGDGRRLRELMSQYSKIN